MRKKPKELVVPSECQEMLCDLRDASLRLDGFRLGVRSVHGQALHEGMDDVAAWLEKRYPTAFMERQK